MIDFSIKLSLPKNKANLIEVLASSKHLIELVVGNILGSRDHKLIYLNLSHKMDKNLKCHVNCQIDCPSKSQLS